MTLLQLDLSAAKCALAFAAAASLPGLSTVIARGFTERQTGDRRSNVPPH